MGRLVARLRRAARTSPTSFESLDAAGAPRPRRCATTARCSCRGCGASEYAAEQAREPDYPDAPLLYLHGEDDGCLAVELAGRTAPLLGPGQRVEMVPGAGHFLHLERPDDVNARIGRFLGTP